MGTRQRVVVVDDEHQILAILEEVLRDDGYDPEMFTQPVRALERIVQTTPALVVTDLLMPHMSGQELVRRVREMCGHRLPIAVMSASANIEAVVGLPVQAFVSKPFDLDEFSELVGKLLNG